MPLIQVEVPTAGFLEDKSILDQYNARVKEVYNDNKHLKILTFNDGLVKGSNTFSIILMNKILNEQGSRVARQSDLERLIKINPDCLKGTFEDNGVVLRSGEDPNSYLAQDLIKWLKHRSGKKVKLPVMIPLTELYLENDQNSNYGLSFKLKEGANVIYTPVLNEKTGKFSSENVDEKTGLPNKLGSGDRTFYTRDSGLSGLCLYWDLGLYSNGDDLGYSDSVGRVVVVSGEATQKNLDQYVKRLEAEKDRQTKAIEIRYKKALSTLQKTN